MKADIDCTGLKCPEPVLRTRAMLDTGPGPFTVLIDNDTARDNVRRFAQTAGCEVAVDETDGGFLVSIIPGASVKTASVSCPEARAGSVMLIASDEIGTGEHELGKTLMKMFLYTASESDSPPSTLIFMNSGVRLVTENEETAAHVKKLEEAGTEVLVCGTCLDYYGLKEILKAGAVSNMYDIQSAMVGATLLVSL